MKLFKFNPFSAGSTDIGSSVRKPTSVQCGHSVSANLQSGLLSIIFAFRQCTIRWYCQIDVSFVCLGWFYKSEVFGLEETTSFRRSDSVQRVCLCLVQTVIVYCMKEKIARYFCKKYVERKSTQLALLTCKKMPILLHCPCK